jgi:hypothetical protein
MVRDVESPLESVLTTSDALLRAENDLECFGHITRPTVSKIESLLPFDDAIIYSLLHESIYMNGSGSVQQSIYEIC